MKQSKHMHCPVGNSFSEICNFYSCCTDCLIRMFYHFELTVQVYYFVAITTRCKFSFRSPIIAQAGGVDI